MLGIAAGAIPFTAAAADEPSKLDLAERCPESLPAAAAWPTNIVWSAAEGVIISADIYLEKTLFDAFRPLNATVNAVRPVRPVPPSPVGSLTGCHRWCRCLRQ